jgi:hypothetical protein
MYLRNSIPPFFQIVGRNDSWVLNGYLTLTDSLIRSPVRDTEMNEGHALRTYLDFAMSATMNRQQSEQAVYACRSLHE